MSLAYWENLGPRKGTLMLSILQPLGVIINMDGESTKIKTLIDSIKAFGDTR